MRKTYVAVKSLLFRLFGILSVVTDRGLVCDKGFWLLSERFWLFGKGRLRFWCYVWLFLIVWGWLGYGRLFPLIYDGLDLNLALDVALHVGIIFEHLSFLHLYWYILLFLWDLLYIFLLYFFRIWWKSWIAAIFIFGRVKSS